MVVSRKITTFVHMNGEPTYEELQTKVEVLTAEIGSLKGTEKTLRQRIAYLERMLYGRKSDKLTSKVPLDQPGLFDQVFEEAMEEKAKEIEKSVEEIRKEADRRRKAARKQPARPSKYRYAGLEERVTEVMPEGVDAEQCDIIGHDETRILHREPAKVWVEVVKRPILRPKADRTALAPHIHQAPAPRAIIGGGHVAADMLAQVAIDKFRYHLPEYRQVKQYADLGLKMPTSTLNDWVHAVAAKLEPLYEALRKDILTSDYLQVDEVPWRIADVKGKSRHGYAWQFHDARPRGHGLYFLYLAGSRGGLVPRAELKNYHGAIQTDGYGVYDYFEEQPGITLLGCMAHVRRKFTEAQSSHPALAAQAVEWIRVLYELEANLAEQGADEKQIAAERQAKAMPVMEAMEAWMKTVSAQCTPSDPMGKALEYAYKLWPRLKRYALDGRYHIDNNPVERGQRPSVMGRKNYLFSKSDDGAVDNAIFYSLIESCEAVGVNPLEWMTHALSTLHEDMPDEELEKLLPYNYKENRNN